MEDMMKKALDSTILWELNSLAKEKNIDFKKWFEDEQMMLESIPVSIYELMKVLPKNIRPNDLDSELIIYWNERQKDWSPYYLFGMQTWRRESLRAPELVDALGKLLIWCIEEGWVG
jgi:hypothetical protein